MRPRRSLASGSRSDMARALDEIRATGTVTFPHEGDRFHAGLGKSGCPIPPPPLQGRMPERQWPELSALRDGPTIATLHLVSQIVGKMAAALLPWRNHSWHPALHPPPRGFRTEPLYGAGAPFEVGLDLIDHDFVFADARGTRRVPLRPTTLADFHAEVLALLEEARRDVPLDGAPNEVEPSI